MSNPIIPHDEPAPDVAGTTGTTGTDGTKRRDWLELPRNITLKRFVNTSRETHFIGQYRDDKNPGNPNPRRIYRIIVTPRFYDATPGLPLGKLFTVEVSEDTKRLFTLNTERGRAVAEYLGVKALKAWLNYCGSQRCGKACRKKHRAEHKKAHRAEYRKRYRANLRARKAAALNPVNPVNPVQNKEVA